MAKGILLYVAIAYPIALLAMRPKPFDEHTVRRTLEHGGRERVYYLHVPPAYSKEKPAALVIALHGGGSTAIAMEKFSRFSELSEKEGFLVAYPDGVARQWNDEREMKGSRAHRENVDDTGFISAMIDAIAKEYSIDAKRVFATGISNGGIFSLTLAARLSGRIAAVGAVTAGMAPKVFETFQPERPVSVLLMNGTEDPLVPYEGGELRGVAQGRVIGTEETVRKWTEFNGCEKPVTEELPGGKDDDGTRVKRSVYSEGREGTEVVLYRIEGGGHTWPGGVQYLPERMIGRVCRDLDATKVIWEFFKGHSRP